MVRTVWDVKRFRQNVVTRVRNLSITETRNQRKITLMRGNFIKHIIYIINGRNIIFLPLIYLNKYTFP